jgi:hypothetical protein
MKSRRVGAELFHEGGRTDKRKDMTKLKVAFRNFAIAPKNDREVETSVTPWPTTQYGG